MQMARKDGGIDRVQPIRPVLGRIGIVRVVFVLEDLFGFGDPIFLSAQANPASAYT